VQVKDLIIIGGPNGAGKTTAAYELLPQYLRIHQFVNADEIARGLSPFDPEGSAIAAGRIMLDRIHALVKSGESLAFETTCASRSHARLLRTVRASGYRVTLLFLWLPSPAAAVERVARRVRPTSFTEGTGRACAICDTFTCRLRISPLSMTIQMTLGSSLPSAARMRR
jgi:predicted ABC-type ATPase